MSIQDERERLQRRIALLGVEVDRYERLQKRYKREFMAWMKEKQQLDSTITTLRQALAMAKTELLIMNYQVKRPAMPRIIGEIDAAIDQALNATRRAG